MGKILEMTASESGISIYMGHKRQTIYIGSQNDTPPAVLCEKLTYVAVICVGLFFTFPCCYPSSYHIKNERGILYSALRQDVTQEMEQN